jgi:predicted RNase H-like HicB family nuclease
VDDLGPFCARIQVAGSVRRRTEVVGDVEMVAIPRYVPARLFSDCTANLLWEHLHAGDAYRFTKGDHPAGRDYQLALPVHAGVQPPCTRGRRETATMSAPLHYSMLIQWSEEDQAYLVALPECEGRLFNWDAATHGATYEEAAKHGREVLELLVESAREEGEALPAARVFATSTAP